MIVHDRSSRLALVTAMGAVAMVVLIPSIFIWTATAKAWFDGRFLLAALIALLIATSPLWIAAAVVARGEGGLMRMGRFLLVANLIAVPILIAGIGLNLIFA